MITVPLAQQLHAAGLPWEPAVGDHFAVPGTGLDDHPFVISEQTAFVQRLNGVPMIVFHGSTEWALDHVVVGDVVWLPTETQLRMLLDRQLPAPAELRLVRGSGEYTCTVGTKGDLRSFTAPSGEDAYGMALLDLLARAN
ncbi:MAG: pilus assembly protein CpaE [Herpetosiphonaceae bacterium]|nr:pilus assembly protein CpaE [Herpetosiphonaceae bacterium]